jgi:hypothetical protein
MAVVERRTVTLDPQVNYFEAYITLRCGLSCPYCINHAGKMTGW